MPTLATMKLPRPQDWKEFEKMTLTCLKIKWDSPNLTGHARQGQPQAGVDIYGPDYLGRSVGVQCKNTEDLSEAVAKEEILNAESFKPKLSAFYFATTASSDGTLQKKLRLISEERLNAKSFPVGIFFWEDLVSELVKNRAEFKKHYPEIALEASKPNTGPRLLCLLDISFRGVNLHEILELLFGDFSGWGGDDPISQCKFVFRVIKGSGSTLLENETAQALKDACDEALNDILQSSSTEASNRWSTVRDAVDRILDIIRSLEYIMVGQEASAFNLGALLGRWYVNSEVTPSVSDEEESTLIQYFTSLRASPTDFEELEAVLKGYLANKSIEHTVFTPHKIYVIARRLIVRQTIEM